MRGGGRTSDSVRVRDAMRYQYHSGKPYYPDNGSPGFYTRDYDMNVVWTDGHVQTVLDKNVSLYVAPLLKVNFAP